MRLLRWCVILRSALNIPWLTKSTGPCLSSYAVQEKTQEPIFDPSVTVGIDIFDDVPWQPCLTCGDATDEEELLLCDRCNSAYHTYCIGLDTVPSRTWVCDFCQTDAIVALGNMRPSPNRPRTRAEQRRQGLSPDQQSQEWDRIWQGVLIGTNIDLDFPFADDDNDDNERDYALEIDRIQRRMEVSERMNGATRFRDAANAILQARSTRRSQSQDPAPDSQDEIKAWNAYDKINQINTPVIAGSKRKSASASPAQHESAEPQRRLKRPRTRLPAESTEQQAAIRTHSSLASHRREVPFTHSPRALSPRPEHDEGSPTFLQSLLKEVETTPGASSNSLQRGRQNLTINVPARSASASPHPSSPCTSPSSSNHPSPRQRSSSPSHSGSPPPLSSHIGPPWEQHPTFSPITPHARVTESRNLGNLQSK